MLIRIMISYRRNDNIKKKEGSIVEKLCGLLEATGFYSVWFDGRIKPGEWFPDAVADAIYECDYFVPIISANYVASKFCVDELSNAKAHKKPIVPIKTDLDPALYSSKLRSIAHIDYVDLPDTEITAEKLAQIVGALGVPVSEIPAEENRLGIREYPNRLAALEDFRSAIESEFDEIMVIGSSLKGLLLEEDYRETRELLQKKMKQDGVQVRFLLIHPVFADIRARQEKRKPTDIGKEIILGLEELMQWDASRRSIGLYKGTPTCFAIKTTDKMLINPYPYRNVALGSPCIIIDRYQNEAFYEQFGRDHFGVWNTPHTEIVRDLAAKIDFLNKSLERYSAAVQALFKDL